MKHVLTNEIMRRRFREGYYDGHTSDQEFKADVFQVLGVSDNPKRDLMYKIAWDYGHSAGYQEVYNHAIDLVELIK